MKDWKKIDRLIQDDNVKEAAVNQAIWNWMKCHPKKEGSPHGEQEKAKAP